MTTMTNTTLYLLRKPGEPAPAGQVQLSSKKPRRRSKDPEPGRFLYTIHVPVTALEKLDQRDETTWVGVWEDIVEQLAFEVETS